MLDKLFREIVDKYLTGLNFQSINCVRLGYSHNRQSNPVVILITVSWNADPPEWKVAKANIEKMLQKAGLDDVKVEFERGEKFFPRISKVGEDLVLAY